MYVCVYMHQYMSINTPIYTAYLVLTSLQGHKRVQDSLLATTNITLVPGTRFAMKAGQDDSFKLSTFLLINSYWKREGKGGREGGKDRKGEREEGEGGREERGEGKRRGERGEGGRKRSTFILHVQQLTWYVRRLVYINRE